MTQSLLLIQLGPCSSRGDSSRLLCPPLLLCSPLLLRLLDPIKLIKWLQLRIPLPKHPSLDEPRQRLGALIRHELARLHSKDIIQLFERLLLRLRHDQKDGNKRHQVEARVKTKGADGTEGVKQEGKGNAQNRCPEEAGGDGKAHAYFSVREGEDFGRVGEGDRTFTGGVERGEEEDE